MLTTQNLIAFIVGLEVAIFFAAIAIDDDYDGRGFIWMYTLGMSNIIAFVVALVIIGFRSLSL